MQSFTIRPRDLVDIWPTAALINHVPKMATRPLETSCFDATCATDDFDFRTSHCILRRVNRGLQSRSFATPLLVCRHLSSRVIPRRFRLSHFGFRTGHRCHMASLLAHRATPLLSCSSRITSVGLSVLAIRISNSSSNEVEVTWPFWYLGWNLSQPAVPAEYSCQNSIGSSFSIYYDTSQTRASRARPLVHRILSVPAGHPPAH
jgi:hypothetical protein